MCNERIQAIGKVHFCQGQTTACGYYPEYVTITSNIAEVTCKSCLRTQEYINARTVYYENILRNHHKPISILIVLKKMWNRIRKELFK